MPDRTKLNPAVLVDVLLAIACGIGFWWVAHHHLARNYMLDPWNTADMVDYCNGILHLGGEPDVPWSVKRSKITGLIATWFAQDAGVMAGLRSSSAIATGLMGAGLFLWGRVASGRSAGLVAVAAGFSLSPLMLMPRILTFYPIVSAMFVLGAVGVTAGIKYDRPKMMALAGAGIGLALVADVRGLVWAVPWMAGCLIAVWWSAQRKKALLWLLGPLALSFLVGRASYAPDAVSFEVQLDARPLYLIYGSKDAAHQPPHDTGGDFVWGRSAPWKLPLTGWFVVRQLTLDPPPGFPPDVSRFQADDHITPLIPAWIGGGLLALIVLWRDPRTFMAVGATVLPFAIAFHGQRNMAEIYVRFLCQIVPGLAVLIGVGIGTFIDKLPGPLKGKPDNSHLVRAVIAGGVIALFTLGHISSPVSPWARWRRPWPLVGEMLAVHPNAVETSMTDRFKICAGALQRDQDAGLWLPPYPQWGR